MGIQDSIKNGLIIGTGLPSVPTNSPTQYKGRLTEHFADVSDEFIQQYARYASDFFEAQAQGLNPDDVFEYTTVRMRMSDIVKPSAATIQYADDYKNILLESKKLVYIMPGTKFVVMGNTWLATNPNNVSGSDGSGIIRRCNASWNHLDYYGNVLSEPIIVEKSRASANDNDYQEMGLITKGYFNVRCQYNKETEQLFQNSRMILGSGAYQITGFSDFTQEFTGDYSSIRILDFTVRYEEPNLEIDDMVNHIAGGKKFRWDITITGEPTITIGETAQLTATSRRNDVVVTSTGENPIYYLWTSSNRNVAEVDAFGRVTAKQEGVAVITATLAQNPNIKNSFSVTVATADTDPHVSFTRTPPTELQIYEEETLDVLYYENGEETSEIVEWTFGGADEDSYSYTANGNSVTIKCWGGSVTPLTVTATYGEYSVSTDIFLGGL